MKNFASLLALAVLSATPLECMYKICPHQIQTLYETRASRLPKNPHVLARLLDKDCQIKEFYYGMSDMKAFSCFVRNVFYHLKPEDIPLEYCELCYARDSGFCGGTESVSLNKSIESIIHEAPDFGVALEKVACIFKDRNITQQLIALYHVQRTIPLPNIAAWAAEKYVLCQAMYVILMAAVMVYALLLGKMPSPIVIDYAFMPAFLLFVTGFMTVSLYLRFNHAPTTIPLRKKCAHAIAMLTSHLTSQLFLYEMFTKQSLLFLTRFLLNISK